jgi:hypothetical protein
MKNVFLVIIFSLFCVPAFAGSCGSGSCGTVTSRPATSAVVNVVRRPVRFFRGVRSRFQSRRSARQLRGSPVRASRSNSCGSGSCGC